MNKEERLCEYGTRIFNYLEVVVPRDGSDEMHIGMTAVLAFIGKICAESKDPILSLIESHKKITKYCEGYTKEVLEKL